MAKLILHIGSFKTGSTSIQDTLFINKGLLSANNCLYPSLDSNHRWFAYWDNGVRLAQEKNIPLDEARDYITKNRKSLELLVNEHPSATFIISTEFLFPAPENEILEMKDYIEDIFDDYEVVAYIRSPAEMFSSWLNEAVKHGEMKIDEGLENLYPTKSLEYFYNYVKCFEKKFMNVRKFDLSMFNSGSVVKDFTSIFLPKEIIENLEEVKSNLSLTLESMMLAEQLGLKYPLGHADRGRVDYLYNIKGKKFRAPKRFIEKSFKQSEKYLSLLEQDFGISFDEPKYDYYPDKMEPIFNYEVINSIALELNRLSTTGKEEVAIKKAVKILAKDNPEISLVLENFLERVTKISN